MNGRHGIFDNILFALLLVLPLVEWRWTWPRYLARLATGEPGVRFRLYRVLVFSEWAPVLCLLGFWAVRRRPWSRLLLAGSTPLRIGLGFVSALLLIGLLLFQRRWLLARPARILRLRPRLRYAEPLLPHTPSERKLFRLVSVTAGVCEEVLFRGFLIWYLAGWIGPLAAVILSSLLFGAGHMYLGIDQAPKTAFAGLVFAIIAVASGSLWPAILLHAAIDWNSGDLGFRAITAGASSETQKEVHETGVRQPRDQDLNS
jgi:CAAX protease family protein